MTGSLYDNLMEICSSRRSIRSFSDKDVPEDLIEKIIKLSATSPYASNKKNYEILVIKDREKISRLTEIVKESTVELTEMIRDDFRNGFSNYSKYFTVFETAPVLLIPVFKVNPSLSLMFKNKKPEILEWERDSWVKSISCVSMLILLAAQTLGLGSCFVTGALLAEEKLHEFLNIRYGRKIAAIIPIGYAKERG